MYHNWKFSLSYVISWQQTPKTCPNCKVHTDSLKCASVENVNLNKAFWLSLEPFLMFDIDIKSNSCGESNLDILAMQHKWHLPKQYHEEANHPGHGPCLIRHRGRDLCMTVRTLHVDGNLPECMELRMTPVHRRRWRWVSCAKRKKKGEFKDRI